LGFGLDDIPGFIIKGCSSIFIHILRHIFNLSLTQQYFPSAWKEAAVVPVFKRGGGCGGGGSGSDSSKFRLCSKLLSQVYKLFTCIEMATLTVYAQLSLSCD
jgi:hypothetical protein